MRLYPKILIPLTLAFGVATQTQAQLRAKSPEANRAAFYNALDKKYAEMGVRCTVDKVNRIIIISTNNLHNKGSDLYDIHSDVLCFNDRNEVNQGQIITTVKLHPYQDDDVLLNHRYMQTDSYPSSSCFEEVLGNMESEESVTIEYKDLSQTAAVLNFSDPSGNMGTPKAIPNADFLP